MVRRLGIGRLLILAGIPGLAGRRGFPREVMEGKGR